MLLNQAGKHIGGVRPPLLLAVCVLPLFLSACSAPLRMDESYSAARRQHFESEAAEDKNRETPREEKDDYQTIPAAFEVRLDDGPGIERHERAARRVRDARATPSYRELRQARATAFAEADMTLRGGNTYIRHDGSSSNPGQVKFAAAPGALGLRVEASPYLNAVEQTPTALVLVVYHLSDRGALDKLAETEQGMRRLLEGEFFDSSVRGVRQIFVQPGMCSELALDRAENGRYVALVAGYNRPDARTGLFVVPYGIGEYKKKGETSFHRAVSMFTPLPMNLAVHLGESAMIISETGSIYHNLRDSTRILRRQTHYFEEPNTLFMLK